MSATNDAVQRPWSNRVCMTAQTTCRLARCLDSGCKRGVRVIIAIRTSFQALLTSLMCYQVTTAWRWGVGFGSCGVVSVASNVACGPMVQMWEAWKAGKVKEAAEIDRRLGPLYTALFVETSPAPVKFAAELLGICSREVRKPLVSASSQTQELIRAALVHAKLL